MVTWLKLVAAAAVSGALFVLAMPLVGAAWLGWIAFVPVLLATRKAGFLKGFVAGLGSCLLAAWLSTTALVGASVLASGDYSWNYVGFGLYAVVVGLMAGVAAEVKTPNFTSAALLACLAVCVECLTFIKMPAHLALTQYASPTMMAVASVGGIWAVSWLVWASNFVVTELVAANQKLKALGLATGLAVITIATVKPAAVLSPTPETGSYAVLQTETFGAKELLAKQQVLSDTPPKLMVWPELSTAAYDDPAILAFTSSDSGWPVVTTGHDEVKPKPHNQARLFALAASQPYFKRKPFAAEANETIAGTKPVVVQSIDERVGLNICFDSCFPSVMRDTAVSGQPDVIALPTLDPASPNGFIQSAHAAFTTFRAAELGVPIVRAEATAWSMVVDANGSILGHLPTGYDGVGGALPLLGTKMTPYRQFGDWFLWLCAGVLIGQAGSRVANARRPDVTTK